MKKAALLSISLAFFVGLFMACPFTYAGDTIKVGIVDTYTGPATTFTMDVLDGFKLAVDEINAKGGVLGKKIEYTTRDEKFKPDIGLAMAKELVLKENVDILMGTINSATTLAISDFVKKEKIPFFVTFAKSDKIIGEKGHKYIFNMNENTAMAGKAAAIALAKKPYLKYWIAGDDYEYGHAIADGVWNNLKKLKPQVQKVGESWWKVGEADFTPYITQILAAKPDFIIAATGGSGMVNFQKAAKATGLSQKIPFYQHTAIEFAVLSGLGLQGPEGAIGTANYMFYYPQTPENKAFVDAFRKVYNKYPTQPAFYGYTVANFIARAYQKAGVVDKEKFIDALEGMTIEKTAIGPLEVRKCDHQLLLPTFYGVTKKVPEYKDFLIGTDIITVAAKDVAPSCEDIAQVRKKAK